MPIRSNMYNDDSIASLFSNVASALAPPSGTELASLSTAGLNNQKRQQIADLFANPNQPDFDRRGIVAGLYNPTQSFYAQNQNDATTRRGQDVTARTDITKSMLAPVAQDAVRYVPPSIADLYGVNQRQEGLRTPLSETQVKGDLLQQQLPANPPALTDSQTIALTMGSTPVENIIDANGQPRTVLRSEAVGHQPAYAPNATIMSDGLPKPPEGAVWKTGPDGKPVLDERGAPIAIPYQGGPLYQKQQAADQAKIGSDAQHNIVLDAVNTALDQIAVNPNLVTGLGAQLSGGIGGGPANDLANNLLTIKSSIARETLNATRQASPTGGAFGNVSDADMKILQSAYGSLEQSQSAGQLVRNLQKFKQVYYDTINGPGEYAKKQQADAAAAAAGPPLPPGVTEEDVQYTMQIHGLTREQVLARLGGT